ncbi:hypothetical protein [Roseinatronobacter sp.]|uniref:hypothetical protein n=1 Tax=Roseinatronobacter sp. TaxID=1945755 RepID=UPI003F6F9EBE
MSNPDSFINEVTEELRRDRMVGYLRRYGWIAVLLVVLVVGGAAWNEWRKASDRASAQAFGDAVLTALENDDSAGRIQALAQIDATGAQQGVINLLSAGELFETDRAAALAALRAASEDDALTDSYRQLAALKYVIAGGDDVPLAERETILAGLAQPGRPFRPLALEQTALLQLEQGNPERTIEILADLLSQSDVSDALERRATQLIIALGGDPAAN